jgi:hypothetical protein
MIRISVLLFIFLIIILFFPNNQYKTIEGFDENSIRNLNELAKKIIEGQGKLSLSDLTITGNLKVLGDIKGKSIEGQDIFSTGNITGENITGENITGTTFYVGDFKFNNENDAFVLRKKNVDDGRLRLAYFGKKYVNIDN